MDKLYYKQLKRAYESQFEDKFSVKNKFKLEAAKKILKQKEQLNNSKPILRKNITPLDTKIKVNKVNEKKEKEFEKRLKNTSNIFILDLINIDIQKDKSKNTQTNFKSRLNVIHKALYNKPLYKDTIIDVFNDYNKVISTIETKKVKSLTSYFQALAKIYGYHNELKVLDKEQREAYLKYSQKAIYHKNLDYIKKNNLEFKTIKDKEVKKLITNKSYIEKKLWMDYSKLLELYLATNGKVNDIPQDNLIAALFLFLPVERYAFATLKIYKENDKYNINENVLIIDNNNSPLRIYLNEYKTKKIYNTIIIDMSDYKDGGPIIEEIQYYINFQKLKSGDYLFSKNYRDNFGVKVSNVFKLLSGKPITINILRKITASDDFKFRRDAKEMIFDATTRGHLLRTELTEYVKI